MTGSVSGTEIYKHFAKAGELYSSETEVLGAAIRLIMAEKGTVTNKAIILHLINQLECTSDVVQLDVLHNALEMVVGMTPMIAVSEFDRFHVSILITLRSGFST